MLTKSLCSVVVLLATLGWGSPSAGQESWGLTDAEIIALETAGTLLPPPSLVKTIHDDLEAIYFHTPMGLRAMPSWVPGQILVELTQAAMDLFLAGQYRGFDDLNAVYGVPEIHTIHPKSLWIVLDFESPYHPDRLAEIYTECKGVTGAAPNHIGVMDQWQDVSLVKRGCYLFESHSGWGSFSVLFNVTNRKVEVLEASGMGWGGRAQLPVNASTWGQIKANAASMANRASGR